MKNNWQQAWLSNLAILSFQLIFLGSAIAEEVAPQSEVAPQNDSTIQTVDIVSEQKPLINTNPTTNLTSLEQTQSDELTDNNSLSQITSVSELSDVKPSDWAYEALRSLIERYGCIASRDGKFRGNQALTRYEFASGLSTCLDKITQLIGVGTANQVPDQDLATIKKLQADFSTELTTLRTRLDTVEARTTALEANQFSTTTKLSGLVSFNLTGASAGDSVKAEGISVLPPIAPRIPGINQPIVRNVDGAGTTLSNLVWLTLNTSFTGKDVLVTKLAAGNGQSPANQFVSAGLFNSVGVPFLDQTSGFNSGQADFVLGELFYSFPVNDAVRLTVGPRVNWYYHFDFNPFTLPFNGASSFNSINGSFLTSTKRGAGAVVEWNINKQFALHAGYLTESIEFLPGTRPAVDPSKGLFNGTHTITAELSFKPSQTSNVRFLYQRSHLNPVFGYISNKPIIGVADDGFGGPVNDANGDTYGVNFDWLINRRFGVFGRYYYTSTNIDPVTPGRNGGDINAQNIQAGLAFPDLGKQGALGTLSFVVPFEVKSGRQFLASGGGNGGTQYEVEANYFYPVTRNIGLVPSLYVIGNINNFDDNPTVFVGSLRTQLNF